MGSETKILMTSGSSHKENFRVNQSPESISFGKIKSHNQTMEQEKRLLDLLACDTYSAAESKVNEVNSASQLLFRIEEMMSQVQPNERPTRENSWRFIKKAVKYYMRNAEIGSPTTTYMRSP